MCDSVRNPHSDGLVPQVRKRRRFMRSTQHSGRKHRTGKAYSSNHNDRKFSSEADNIDRKKTPDNIVWTWYDKFETSEDGSPLHSIDEVELVFYQERYGKQLAATNEKYKKSRHKERVKSMDQWRKQVKHAPEEVIMQIGKMNDHPDIDIFKTCFLEYLDELEKWNSTHGNVMHILDWALHQDEIGAPHTHTRRVWDYYNPKTKQFELGQEKALEAAGVPLPHPDKAPGRFNNRKMTFDAEMRIVWQNICKEHGLEIETIPLPKNKVGMSLDQKIRQNEEERKRNLEILEAEKETLKTEKESFKTEKELFENEKEVLKNEKESFENEKKSFEDEKESFEAEKQSFKSEKDSFENEKDVLKTEKESFENEKNDFKTEKESLENEKENFELFKKTENDSIEKSKAELAEKTKEAQEILNRESSVTTRETSVTQREADADRREKEQAEWIEKQKTAHEYLKAHDIDSNYFVLDTEIPELLEPEDAIFSSEKRSDYAIRNLKNFKKIIDQKVDHFKRKFNSLVNCVKTLLEENKILRKENKTLKEDLNKTVSAKVTAAENKLRFDLTKTHLEEKAKLQEKADQWDNFLKGTKTNFNFPDGFKFTCSTGVNSIRKMSDAIQSYENLTPYGLRNLADRMEELKMTGNDVYEKVISKGSSIGEWLDKPISKGRGRGGGFSYSDD